MKFTHGDIRIEVPEGWVDATSLAFMEPPDSSLAGASGQDPRSTEELMRRMNEMLQRQPAQE